MHSNHHIEFSVFSFERFHRVNAPIDSQSFPLHVCHCFNDILLFLFARNAVVVSSTNCATAPKIEFLFRFFGIIRCN